ncbi:MAG: hypothetical protein EOL97_13210 [Spirochaetia bacterium]|nr:hypothetical protein [Spirochaetia bacterium]
MKIDCIYVDGGKGHLVPAQAIAEQLEKQGHQVIIEDFYKFLKMSLVGKINKSVWRYLLKHPEIEKKMSSKNDSPSLLDSWVKFGKLIRGSFLKKWAKNSKTDAIICTHYLPSRILSDIFKDYDIKIPVYYYATDVFSCPGFSIGKNIRKFYIPTKEGAEYALSYGQPKESINICPFPLQSSCANSVKLSKEEARKKLNLKNIFTIQLNLGGEGVGTLSLIEEIAKKELSIQIVVIGGMSENSKNKLQNMSKKLPKCINLVVAGFVKNVDEYLYACDIVVGRAGINTMVEALYMNRPFMITDVVFTVIPSVNYVKKYNIGWEALKLDQQVKLIEESIKDKDFLNKMDSNFSKVPMEFGADKLAEMIVKDIKTITF